jgi:recombination protein RecA
MAGLGFLKDFKKNVEKMETVSLGLSNPNKWFTTGNYALNRTLSGSYYKGIPEGRITLLAGPSGAGKSFLSGNLMKQAQLAGAHILILDSENAVDEEYLRKIGVKTDEDHLTYLQVDTIEDVNKVMSDFFKSYEKEHGQGNYEAQPFLIVLDSIAMLSTETEQENYEKGEIRGDQGQRSKRTKAMLRMMVKKASRFPITIICTDHVYPGDVMKGEGEWAITNSTKFSPSIIGIITKLKLKEETEVVGIRMRVEAFKSRFAKLGSKVEIEVPYSTGMSQYSGLLELLEIDGVVSKAGAWYSYQNGDETLKFQRKQLNEELVQKLLSHPIVQKNEKLFEEVEEEIVLEDI